jgi:hypothetical protein
MRNAYIHNNYLVIGLLCLFIFFILGTESTQAYFTTGQAAVAATDKTALYTIDYRFGNFNEDVYMPLFAMRDLPHGSESKSAGYELLENGDTPIGYGTAAGIIFSDLEIKDDMYLLPAGEIADFTLFVIFTVAEDLAEADYAVHMQELPFYRGEDREPNKMNPSELQYYVTPEVELNNATPSISVNLVDIVASDGASVNFTVTKIGN